MYANKSKPFAVLLIFVLALPALAIVPSAGAQEEVYFPTTEWRTSTPEEQGMDSEVLLSLLKRGVHVDSMLVIRHGYVVLDVSDYPYTADQPHYLASVTKVITSTLLGMVIDQGYVQGVDQSIWDFFPKNTTANMDERKAAITVRHLLTQTSGFDFVFGEDWRQFSPLTDQDQSWIQFLLDRPMATEPGTTFNYMDGNPLLVSAIIGQTTGVPADEFARQHLFDPLGMGEVLWLHDPQGVSQGGDRCFMSTYDMARLGYLFLNQGVWDDQQIVPAAWVEEATRSVIVPHYWEGYGYYWYSGPFGSRDVAPRGYSAIGSGGQEIWVIPDLDLIVILTGDSNFIGLSTISSVIIPAIQSDTALPANPEAASALQAAIDQLAHPVPGEVKPLPEAAQQAAGVVYTLSENDLGWQTVSVEFGAQEATLTLGLADRTVVIPIGLDGVERVSSSGLPPEPVLRPVDNVPLASKAGWRSTTFVISTRDLLGLTEAEIRITFGERLSLNVAGLGLAQYMIRGDPQ